MRASFWRRVYLPSSEVRTSTLGWKSKSPLSIFCIEGNERSRRMRTRDDKNSSGMRASTRSRRASESMVLLIQLRQLLANRLVSLITWQSVAIHKDTVVDAPHRPPEHLPNYAQASDTSDALA